MKKIFIIFTIILLSFFSGCSKKYITSVETDTKVEKTTESLNEKMTEKSTEAISQKETGLQITEEKKMFFSFEQGRLTEVYIDGRRVVENKYKGGLRAIKDGADYCEFTYNSENDMTSEVRNGKLITYLYKEQENSMYLTLNGFNYEGNDYYYTKDNMGRIDGITNAEGELTAKYEYDTNGFKVVNVLGKAGNEWVSNNDAEFIGNVNRIRHQSSYFDIETELYYQNAVFYNSIDGAVVKG